MTKYIELCKDSSVRDKFKNRVANYCIKHGYRLNSNECFCAKCFDDFGEVYNNSVNFIYLPTLDELWAWAKDILLQGDEDYTVNKLFGEWYSIEHRELSIHEALLVYILERQRKGKV